MTKKLALLNLIGITFAYMSASHAATPTLTKTDFPTTIADVPRDIRNENLSAGYQPFKDASAYKPLENIESEEEALERMLRTLQAQYEIDKLTLSDPEYCRKYFDEERCEEDRNGYGYLIERASSNSASRAQDNNAQRTVSGRAATSAAIPGRAAASGPQQQFSGFWKTSQFPTKYAPQTAPAQKPKTNTTATQNANQIATDLSQTNNKKHNGKCYPSATSRIFTNKILTSGKYESTDPAFEKALVQIFRVEGDCDKLAGDSGGYTCYGLASAYNPDIDFKTLTRAKAEDIIYERYYRKQNSHLLPDTIRGDVLRINFNVGTTSGTKRLQRILGLTQTGKVDEDLVNAVHEYKGNLHDAFWDSMRDFYVSLVAKKPAFKNFIKGWLNSVQLFRNNGCHVTPEEPLLR